MMRYLFIITMILSCFQMDVNATNINPDQEYVWARSGLNVRSGPGTSYDVVEKLVFGDSVIVISETEISYNITGIAKVDTNQYYSSRHEQKDPYILYGNWIEVHTANGKIGYVINQYLIGIKPDNSVKDFPLEEIGRDTVSIYGQDGAYETSILLKCKYGINGNITMTQGCGGEGYVLPGYTLQDAFVMLMKGSVGDLVVYKNWPNELVIGDGWMSNYSFKLIDGNVYFYYEACC